MKNKFLSSLMAVMMIVTMFASTVVFAGAAPTIDQTTLSVALGGTLQVTGTANTTLDVVVRLATPGSEVVYYDTVTPTGDGKYTANIKLKDGLISANNYVLTVSNSFGGTVRNDVTVGSTLKEDTRALISTFITKVGALTLDSTDNAILEVETLKGTIDTNLLALGSDLPDNKAAYDTAVSAFGTLKTDRATYVTAKSELDTAYGKIKSTYASKSEAQSVKSDLQTTLNTYNAYNTAVKTAVAAATGYSDKITAIQNEITRITDVVIPAFEQAEAEAAILAILDAYEVTSPVGASTNSLGLPTGSGMIFEWTAYSDQASGLAIAADGTVSHPTGTGADVSATLTLTGTKGAYTQTRTYTLAFVRVSYSKADVLAAINALSDVTAANIATRKTEVRAARAMVDTTNATYGFTGTELAPLTAAEVILATYRSNLNPLTLEVTHDSAANVVYNYVITKNTEYFTEKALSATGMKAFDVTTTEIWVVSQVYATADTTAPTPVANFAKKSVGIGDAGITGSFVVGASNGVKVMTASTFTGAGPVAFSTSFLAQ